MAFVNAWITQDDWDNPKYRLHELAARHRPWGILKPDKECAWVIDRERNIYLTQTDMWGDREDWREPGAYCMVWSMFWKDMFVEMRLTWNWSYKKSDDSYSIIWSFWGFHAKNYLQPTSHSEMKYVFYLLKEALTIFGMCGPREPTNSIVTFTF